MPKWKKGETDFPVSVNFNEARGYQTSIPKPIMKFLGEPDMLHFIIDGKIIKLKAGKHTEK